MRILCVADDLTGCAATGGLFRQQNLRTVVLPRPENHLEAALSDKTSQAVIWNSATRTLPAEQAAERIRGMTEQIQHFLETEKYADSMLLTKRIDSTFRGEVAAELQAMLEAARRRLKAIVVPAFPDSGRAVVNGQLTVFGVPVHETEAGQDFLTPVTESDVCRLIKSKSSLDAVLLRTGEYPLLQSLVSRIEALMQGEAQVIVCDAQSNKDIRSLAQAFATLEEPVLPVDPGPFTAAYFQEMRRRKARVLVICGSMMPTMQKQLERFQMDFPNALFAVDMRRLSSEGKMALVHDIRKRLLAMEERPVSGFRTDLYKVADVNASALTEIIAEAVAQALQEGGYTGVYLSGGEVASRVLQKIGVEALEVMAEIQPLCVLSQIQGGPQDGLHVVTKGGSVGNETAILESVHALFG